MKKEALFFAAGVLTAVSITALAAQLEVNPNSFPITINGEPVEIEGYNLNDNTYFKLRDIGDKLGFDVGFENDTIVITKNNERPSKPDGAQDKGGQPIPGISGQLPEGEGATPAEALEELKTRLAQKVESGEMTQAEADEIINRFGEVPPEKPQQTGNGTEAEETPAAE